MAISLTLAVPAVAATQLGGTLYRVSHDEFVLVDASDRTVPLTLSGETPASGSSVVVSGEHDGSTFVVQDVQITRAAPATYVTGTREALVIRVGFSDIPEADAPSEAHVRDAVFTGAGSAAAFIREASFGETTIAGHVDPVLGDVTGAVRIDRRVAGEDPCNYTRWGDDARTAARSAGWDLSAYEHIIHWFPGVAFGECGAAGRGGGPYVWMFVGDLVSRRSDTVQNESQRIVTHEMGHSLAFNHAWSRVCRDAGGQLVSLSSSCDAVEYGDVIDVMGSGTGHYQAFLKGSAGWLRPENTMTLSRHGTYDVEIAPLGMPSSGVQNLRIEIPAIKPAKLLRYLAVEYRQPGPLFESLSTNATKGASVRVTPDYGSWYRGELVDTTPATAERFRDAALEPGRGVYDPLSKVLIRTLAATSHAVTVRVAFPYDDSAPTADAGEPHRLTPEVPHEHSTARAVDPDADLASYTWEFASCPDTCPPLSSASGSLFGSDATVPGPRFTPQRAGQYTLRLTVRDGAGNAATATVTEEAAI